MFVYIFPVTYLEPGSHAHVLPELGSFGYAIESINIYCYQGSDRELAHLLRSVYLQINVRPYLQSSFVYTALLSLLDRL